jgi:adenylate cyclase
MTFTLRFSLLAIFITLFVIITGTFFGVFYIHLHKLTLNAAFLLIDRASYSILHGLDVKLHPLEAANLFSVENIYDGAIHVDDAHEMTFYMMRLLEKLALAKEIYWGDVNGNWISVRKAEHGFTSQIITRSPIKTPAASTTTAKTTVATTQATATFVYLDKQYREVGRRVISIDYDPRNRPWFIQAATQKKTIWTDVYTFEPTSYYLGITVATPIFHQNGSALLGVFGIDIGLDYLSRFLETQTISKKSEIILLDKHGVIIATPSLARLELLPAKRQHLQDTSLFVDKPWVKAAATIYQDTHQTFFQFKSNDATYLASFRSIPTLANNNWFIGIVAPAADFTHQLHIIEFAYLFFDVTIFALGIAVMLMLVTRVVTPIKKLVAETEKIKQFDLSSSKPISSHIREVTELSEAIDSMKIGLRSFKKYVPDSLVRQLIKAGEDAIVGGAKRDIAVFFSDIRGFTAIASETDSNELIKQVYEYFDALSQCIITEQGVIDKYIGDSVMAFWGAPHASDNPCAQAAHAALECMKKIKILNEVWAKQKKHVFQTRIGIHFGEAIVGNVGSSERLNYTALGDTVNIASRLISESKIYGIPILVTETVYQQIKNDYILRLVDHVVFTGKHESIAIYELIGEKDDL